MAKKILIVLVFLAFSSGLIFADDKEVDMLNLIIFFQRDNLDNRMDFFDVELEFREGRPVLTGEVSHFELVQTFIEKFKEQFPEEEILNETTLVSGLGYAMIGEKYINVKGNPGGQSIVTQLIFGDPVHILEKEGNWARIQGPDLYLGWVRVEDLITMERGEFEIWRRGEFYLVQSSSATLYQGRDSGSQKISEILHGSRLHVVEKTDSWARIFLPGALDGWINLDKLIAEVERDVLDKEKIIETAKKYTGVPYLWAGTHIEGADCSGYVQRVLAVNGIYYPRDSDQQFYFSQKISREEMRRGDLIFFSTYREGPSHLGIYLGNEEFIHASSGAREVTIDSLDPQKENYNQTLHNSFLSGAGIRKNFEFLAPWMHPDSNI